MKRKSIIDAIKPKLVARTTQPIHITEYNDGYAASVICPNGTQISFKGKDWHYMMARLYNKVKRFGFVASKEVIESKKNEDVPK